ncbi:MAG: DMT family transporter [Gemmatimonadales bacterium]
MTRRGAILSLWVTCLIWGTAFPLGKLALADATPMAFTASRFVLATLLLTPWLRRPARAEWRAGAILGALLALGFATQTVGLGITTASRSGFLTALYIPFTPMIVYAVFRRRPGRLATIGLALGLAGLILLTGPGPLAGGFNRGDMLTVACAACFAAHMVATGTLTRRHPPGRLMITQIVWATVFTLLMLPVVETPVLHPTPALIAIIGYEAILASVVAIRLQLAAQQVLSPTYTALIYTLEPVIAALTSFLIAGDRLSPLQWGGGALILTGSLLPEFGAHQSHDPVAEP